LGLLESLLTYSGENTPPPALVGFFWIVKPLAGVAGNDSVETPFTDIVGNNRDQHLGYRFESTTLSSYFDIRTTTYTYNNMEREAHANLKNGNEMDRHSPFLTKWMLQNCEGRPLENVVLTGADLRVVRDVYDTDPEALTRELVYDAYLYGVSNDGGVLDFLCKKMTVDDFGEKGHFWFKYEDVVNESDYSFLLTPTADKAQIMKEDGVSIINLVPAIKKILSKQEIIDVYFDFNKDREEVCVFDLKTFFGIIESVFNSNASVFRLDMPSRFRDYGTADETPEEVIASISAIARQGRTKIKHLDLAFGRYDQSEYLDLFLSEVVLKLPALEHLQFYAGEALTPQNIVSLSNQLTGGQLKKLELDLDCGSFPPEFWPTLRAPLAQNSTLKHLDIKSVQDDQQDVCWEELLNILRRNTSLEMATLNESEHSICACSPVKFYLALNQLGRGQFRDPDVPISRLVHNLISAQKKCPTALEKYMADCQRRKVCPHSATQIEKLNACAPHESLYPRISPEACVASYLYGLLREYPSNWTGAADASGENSRKDNAVVPMIAAAPSQYTAAEEGPPEGPTAKRGTKRSAPYP